MTEGKTDKERKVRRTLIIEPSLWGRLQARAGRDDVSASRLIRELIREDLRRRDRAARASSPD